MIEKQIEEQILGALSTVGGENFTGLWGADKTEQADDNLIVRVLVNPLLVVDGQILKTTVEIALACRKECDTDGTIFSTASNTLLQILKGWESDYYAAVSSLSCEGFVPCARIIRDTDGTLDVVSSPVSNITNDAEYDPTNSASVLKCTFELTGTPQTSTND